MKHKYNAVMLLDDNDMDNFIHKSMMEALSFSKNIYVSTRSISALDFLETLTKDFPEIIFVDLNIPTMNGLEFIEEFKIRYPKSDTTLIILSSALKRPMVDEIWFSKPLTKYIMLSV